MKVDQRLDLDSLTKYVLRDIASAFELDAPAPLVMDTHRKLHSGLA